MHVWYVVNLIMKFYEDAGSFKSVRAGRLLSLNSKSWHSVRSLVSLFTMPNDQDFTSYRNNGVLKALRKLQYVRINYVSQNRESCLAWGLRACFLRPTYILNEGQPDLDSLFASLQIKTLVSEEKYGELRAIFVLKAVNPSLRRKEATD
jgi:hypothetical protein